MHFCNFTGEQQYTIMCDERGKIINIIQVIHSDVRLHLTQIKPK